MPNGKIPSGKIPNVKIIFLDLDRRVEEKTLLLIIIELYYFNKSY